MRYVIHTVGPVWRGGAHGEPDLLAACYRNSLGLAAAHEVRRIAFPCISTGVYRYPSVDAARTAVSAVRGFAAADMEEIVFCCFSEADRALYAALLDEA